MKKEKKATKWFYWLTFAIAVILISKVVGNLGDISTWIGNFISILMPFLIGILIAYLFYIPCRQIEKLYKKAKPKFIKNKARGLSVLTVYLIATLLVVLAINILIPALSESIVDLASNLPSYYQSAIEYINNLPSDSIISKESVQGIISNLQKIDITKIISIDNIFEYIKSVVGFASSIFNFFVTIIMSVYVLLERGEIIKFIKRLNKALFKEETCKAIDGYFAKANEIFFKFISSQVLDAIIVGTIVSIAMWLLDIKYFALLGFIIGLLNVIPYFGAIIGVVIATIVTVFTGGFAKALWMLIVIIILQQIDANVINPKIIGNALKLSPILVIFAVTVFGAYYGVLGMFLAVPIIAIIKILVTDFVEYKIKTKEQEEI